MPNVDDSAVSQLADLGSSLWRDVPASAGNVAALEKVLSVTLPRSYKSFLSAFGAVAVGDVTISGIVSGDPMSPEGGSLFGDTQRFRSECGLPLRFLVLQPDEDAPYCMDMLAPTLEGEYAVVCYELSSGHAQRIASTFSEWVIKFFVPCSQ